MPVDKIQDGGPVKVCTLWVWVFFSSIVAVLLLLLQMVLVDSQAKSAIITDGRYCDHAGLLVP